MSRRVSLSANVVGGTPTHPVRGTRLNRSTQDWHSGVLSSGLAAWGMDADLVRTIDPTLPVLVAGDPEALNREIRLQDGIPIPRSLADKIRAICRRCGIPFVLE